MPNFKPKANKKLKFNKKTKITLDNTHREKMEEIKNIKSTIPTSNERSNDEHNKFWCMPLPKNKNLFDLKCNSKEQERVK